MGKCKNENHLTKEIGKMEELFKGTPGVTAELVLLALVLREGVGLVREIIKAAFHSDDEPNLKIVATQVNDLWQWHNVKGPDGAPLWYVRQDIDKNIQRLAQNMSDQTKVMVDLFKELRDLQRDMLHEIKINQREIARLDDEIKG